MLNTAGDIVGATIMATTVVPIFARARASFITLREQVAQATAWEYPGFPEASSYCAKMSDATSDIWILDTFSFLIEPENAPDFRAAVTKALDNNVTVRVLLVAPGSEAAIARRKTLSEGRAKLPPVKFDLNLSSNLSVLFQMLGEQSSRTHGSLEVKLYKIDPAVAYHRIDNMSLVAFYPIDTRAENSPQLEVAVTNPVGSLVSRRFDEIWQSSIYLLDYYTCTVKFTDNGQSQSFTEIAFVDAGGKRLLLSSDPAFIAAVNRQRVVIRWGIDGADGMESHYDVEPVLSGPLLPQARDAARRKYGQPDGHQFFELRSRQSD